MPTKLRKLKITRVAVCEQGANYDPATGEGAHILLFKAQPLVTKDEATCDDPDCDAADCPVHGTAAKRKKKPVDKQNFSGHAEPDGDETPPLDYATRGQQEELWCCLWDKWERFCGTFYDIVGDGDDDNVPYLPILVDSLGQFQADVAQLLDDCGVAKQVTPLLAALTGLAKAGAPMAEHRLARLREAITQLQQILVECTPLNIDRPGVSAADVACIPGIMKGDASMAETLEGVTRRAETAEAVLKDLVTKTDAQVATLTKRAETAEARVAELEPLVAKVAELDASLAKMQQTPEEQEAAYWASVPEPVRKKHEADEAEKVELRKRLQEADERVEKADLVAKTAEFRGFGMVPEKHWRIVKHLLAMPEEEREELTRLIKANMAQVEKSALFQSNGHSYAATTGSPDSGSASEQLMTLTHAYMKEHGVDFVKASEAISKEHRDLYQKMITERRHAARVSTD